MSDEISQLKKRLAQLEAKQSARAKTRPRVGGLRAIMRGFIATSIVIGIIAWITSKETSHNDTTAGVRSANVSEPNSKMTSAEILASARSVADKWAKELKSGQGRWPITAEEVRKLRVALDNIQSPPAEKMAAAAMLDELSRLRHQQEKLDEAAEEKIIAAEEKRTADNASGRAQYAATMERLLLQQWMDVTVRVSGNKNTTLTIEYALMSRPLVFNLINDAGTTEAIGRQGFKVVVLTDGYDSSWRFAFSKTGWKAI
jgi:hypothetical protein